MLASDGAIIAVTPSGVNFGVVTVGSTSAPQGLTIRNVGDAPSGTLTFALIGDDGCFSFDPGTCAQPIPPGSSCTFFVSFAPRSTGGHATHVTVTNGEDFGSVPLTGGGTMGPLFDPYLPASGSSP